jgi:hypothetical protein
LDYGETYVRAFGDDHLVGQIEELSSKLHAKEEELSKMQTAVQATMEDNQ